MHACLRWLPVAALALATSSLCAAPLDFTGQPITCTDPPGATVPTPCALTATPRSDGYSLIGYSFLFIIPPPGPPPFIPIVVKNDSKRDFFNPVMQDIFVNIFGDTTVDVMGAPVLFFVSGTLDGVEVVSFSVPVGGLGNDMSWNLTGLVEDVTPGIHTLDMHFGFIQIVPQQSTVRISSLYQITVNPVPEPAGLALVLTALGLSSMTCRGGRRRVARHGS